MGHLVKTDIVCTEAVESDELLGYADTETRFVISKRIASECMKNLLT